MSFPFGAEALRAVILAAEQPPVSSPVGRVRGVHVLPQTRVRPNKHRKDVLYFPKMNGASIIQEKKRQDGEHVTSLSGRAFEGESAAWFRLSLLLSELETFEDRVCFVCSAAITPAKQREHAPRSWLERLVI